MAEMSEAEIELKIINKIDNIASKIADKCIERIQNAQHDCEAFRITRNKEDWKKIVDCPEKLDGHIRIHKVKEKWFRIGFTSMIALFGGDKLMSLIVKIIQSTH